MNVMRPCHGGPYDGQQIEVDEDTSLVVVGPGYDEFAYHRTHRLVSGVEDPDWFIKNLPEPQYETVLEWHEKGWVSPAVQAIRDAYRGASE